MPTEKEVKELLSKLFSERPCQVSDSFSIAVKILAGKPLSDSDFLVRESARLAAKESKYAIDDDSVRQALDAVVKDVFDKDKKPLGFV